MSRYSDDDERNDNSGRKWRVTKPKGEARMDCRDAVGLLPCPFCGSDGEELGRLCDHSEGADNSGPSRRIQCYGCNVEAPFYDTEAEAVAAWNTRALSPPVPTGEGEAVAWRAKLGEYDRWTLCSADPTGEPGWYSVQPLYTHPKPAQGEGVEALREKVARIIDPAAFLFDRGELDDKVWSRSRAVVFAQADAILAALAAGKDG